MKPYNLDVTSPVTMVQSLLKQLEEFRDDGRVPPEDLLWEIGVYEFILKSADPMRLATQWVSTYEDDIQSTVKRLGWVIR